MESQAMTNLIAEREAQLQAKPWFLLNSGIPVGQFCDEEKKIVDTQLAGWKSEGQNLDHITWRNCGE